MKMSTVLNLAATGAIAMAFGATNAFALSGELSDATVNLIERDANVQKWMSNTLHVSPNASAAEINMSLGKLTSQQRAAVAGVLGGFAHDENPNAKTNEEKARNKTLFNALVASQSATLMTLGKVALNVTSNKQGVAAPAKTTHACSEEEFVGQVANGADLDKAALLAAAHTPALVGHVTMGECQADAGGLPSYDGVAKANFGKAWIIVADRERGVQSVTKDVAKNDWTIALSGVLQETPAQAAQLFDKLSSPQASGGCGILAY